MFPPTGTTLTWWEGSVPRWLESLRGKLTYPSRRVSAEVSTDLMENEPQPVRRVARLLSGSAVQVNGLKY